MSLTRRKISINWLALGLLVLLSAGVAAPIARLWLPEPVTCGMACCEASGVCYCEHHADNEETAGQVSPSKETRTVSQNAASIGQSCQTRCAQIPSGFQKHSFANVTAPRLALGAKFIRQCLHCVPRVTRDTLLTESQSPRAPPVTLS